MPWGAVVAVGGAYLSYKGAKDASDRAGDAASLEHDYRMRQLDLQQEGLDFSKEQYAKHEARWDPVLDQLLEEYDDYQPDYLAIAGDVKSAFASERGQAERRNRRYGIRPDDGLSRQFNRQSALEEAATHVGARNQARRGAEEIRYSRLSDLYGMGQGLQSNSAAALSSAYRGASAGYGSAANSANSNMRYYDQLAAGNAGGVGSSLASVDWNNVFNNVRGWFGGGGGGGSGGGGGWGW